jgi:hypothetical protein
VYVGEEAADALRHLDAPDKATKKIVDEYFVRNKSFTLRPPSR